MPLPHRRPATAKTPHRRGRARRLAPLLAAVAAWTGLAACWGPPESTVINNLFDEASRRPVRSYFYIADERTRILLALQFPAGSPAAALTDYIEGVGGACPTRVPPGADDRFERIHCTYQNVTYSVRGGNYRPVYHESLYTWQIEIEAENGNIESKSVVLNTKTELLDEDEYLQRLRLQTETGSSR